MCAGRIKMARGRSLHRVNRHSEQFLTQHGRAYTEKGNPAKQNPACSQGMVDSAGKIFVEPELFRQIHASLIDLVQPDPIPHENS
jgi:hypothetical protein